MSESNQAESSSISRRTLAKGAAWAAPAIAAAAAAPVHAVSPGALPPGINGWMNVTYSDISTWSNRCRHRLDITSRGTGSTPDGAPWGLFIYQVPQPGITTAYNAQIIWWVRGDTNVSWSTRNGHSTCWGSPVKGAAVPHNNDGIYTPYTWTYSNSGSCVIDTSNIDNGRVFLGDFIVRGEFQLASNICNMVCYWAQRKITIDPDGPGPKPPVEHQFERKRGFRDCTGQDVDRLAPQSKKLQVDDDVLDEKSSEEEYVPFPTQTDPA